MRAWLVNTNTKSGRPEEKRDNPNGFKYMLRHNKAAGYYPSKPQLDRIQIGDLVLLYHNENRVIAIGCVVSPPQEHDYEDIAIAETWVDVNWLWKADFNKLDPTNPINRHNIGLGSFAGIEFRVTVLEVTNHLDYKALFSEIASRQKFL